MAISGESNTLTNSLYSNNPVFAANTEQLAEALQILQEKREAQQELKQMQQAEAENIPAIRALRNTLASGSLAQALGDNIKLKKEEKEENKETKEKEGWVDKLSNFLAKAIDELSQGDDEPTYAKLIPNVNFFGPQMELDATLKELGYAA